MGIRYMGSKARLAKTIAAHLMFSVPNKEVTYWEPFVGGANSFEVVAPLFKRAIGSDVHEDLILMWQKVMTGWVPPTNVSEEMYREYRKREPSALRGFIGFGCSFGARWFEGYANSEGRNHPAESSRSVARTYHKLKNLSAEFRHHSYEKITPSPGDVVYCDPPYEDTKGYGVKFNHDEFWDWAEQLSRSGIYVLVSEYDAPSGWESILETELIVTMNTKDYFSATERLFEFKG